MYRNFLYRLDQFRKRLFPRTKELSSGTRQTLHGAGLLLLGGALAALSQNSLKAEALREFQKSWNVPAWFWNRVLPCPEVRDPKILGKLSKQIHTPSSDSPWLAISEPTGILWVEYPNQPPRAWICRELDHDGNHLPQWRIHPISSNLLELIQPLANPQPTSRSPRGPKGTLPNDARELVF